jgi:hypothetical protein
MRVGYASVNCHENAMQEKRPDEEELCIQL